MRVLLQRVSSAAVTVEGEIIGSIDRGLVVYLGVGLEDQERGAKWLADKTANLRIFEDDAGKMNLSVQDVGGGILAIPNFTLMAHARKGRRPSFAAAAPPGTAEPLYDTFCKLLLDQSVRVERGAFGCHMDIASVADGPVNVVIDYPPDA